MRAKFLAPAQRRTATLLHDGSGINGAARCQSVATSARTRRIFREGRVRMPGMSYIDTAAPA